MFDISSQLLLKLMRKWRITIIKIYGNEDQISKHHYGPDFLCFFKFMSLRIFCEKMAVNMFEDFVKVFFY